MMDSEVDMLKFWVQQLQEILPEPLDDDEEDEGQEDDFLNLPERFR